MTTESIQINSIDYHTGGEPFRIVTDGYGELDGQTVAERGVSAQNSSTVEKIRQLLVRNLADTRTCTAVSSPSPTIRPQASDHLLAQGRLSTACGHGTMALGVWAVEEGIVESDPNGTTVVVIDVPSGRVAAHVESRDGIVHGVTFENVPSYVVGQDLKVDVDGKKYTVDLAYGGAIYACLDVAQVDLNITKENYSELRAIGRAVKWACNDLPEAQHSDPRQSGVYGTILFQKLDDLPTGPNQINMTVFADGEVDRSPCGSGTSARLACLAATGEITQNSLKHDSSWARPSSARSVPTPCRARSSLLSSRWSPAWRTGPDATSSTSTRRTSWGPVSPCSRSPECVVGFRRWAAARLASAAHRPCLQPGGGDVQRHARHAGSCRGSARVPRNGEFPMIGLWAGRDYPGSSTSLASGAGTPADESMPARRSPFGDRVHHRPEKPCHRVSDIQYRARRSLEAFDRGIDAPDTEGMERARRDALERGVHYRVVYDPRHSSGSRELRWVRGPPFTNPARASPR